MKRMKLRRSILVVPILLGMLLGASGCCCMWPWRCGDGHHGDGHHGDGDHYRDGGHYHDGGGRHDGDGHK
jgi:hypothetical protein